VAKSNRVVIPLLIILFGIGVVAGIKIAGWFNLGSKPRKFDSVAILQQVKSLSELVTVQYVIEKVEGVEVPSEHLIGQLIGSENRVLILAHGSVKAGIDLSQLKPEDLHVNEKNIIINLPSAKITDAYLDDSLTKTIDHKTGLLAPPDKDLEQTVRQNAVDSIRRAARQGGILKEADARARTQLKNLFLQLGFEKVEFKDQAPSFNAAPVEKPIP
jgi:hypothetical protein